MTNVIMMTNVLPQDYVFRHDINEADALVSDLKLYFDHEPVLGNWTPVNSNVNTTTYDVEPKWFQINNTAVAVTSTLELKDVHEIFKKPAIGRIYSRDQRRAKILRYQQKRQLAKQRNIKPVIRNLARSTIAKSRPRLLGRFVKT